MYYFNEFTFTASVMRKKVCVYCGITTGHPKVSILLFADDIVLITEKENELQTLLDKLHTWC